MDEAAKAKLTKQIDVVVSSLSENKKAAPRAGGIRSFMKTQKNELQDMTLAMKEKPAAAMATSEDVLVV